MEELWYVLKHCVFFLDKKGKGGVHAIYLAYIRPILAKHGQYIKVTYNDTFQIVVNIVHSEVIGDVLNSHQFHSYCSS